MIRAATAVLRIGYNASPHVGFSVTGGAASSSGVSYLTPSAAVWGFQTVFGVRHMVGKGLALRLEGRLEIEGYDEVPMTKSTVVNPLVTFGLSYFVGGRKKGAGDPPG